MATAHTAAWAARATTPPARPSTKSRACSASAFPAARPSSAKLPRGDPARFPFPRAWLEPDTWDFSFSGLKTAVRHQVRALGIDPDHASPEERRAAFAGRRSCRQLSRPPSSTCWPRKASPAPPTTSAPRAWPWAAASPPTAPCCARVESAPSCRSSARRPALCTDNAAMIASAGYFRYRRPAQRDPTLHASTC